MMPEVVLLHRRGLHGAVVAAAVQLRRICDAAARRGRAKPKRPG